MRQPNCWTREKRGKHGLRRSMCTTAGGNVSASAIRPSLKGCGRRPCRRFGYPRRFGFHGSPDRRCPAPALHDGLNSPETAAPCWHASPGGLDSVMGRDIRCRMNRRPILCRGIGHSRPSPTHTVHSILIYHCGRIKERTGTGEPQ